MKIDYKFIDPGAPTPETRPLEARDVVVMSNWLGNSTYNWEGRDGLGDAGRLGTHVARSLGCTVLVYDRPGTGNNEPIAPLGGSDYIDAVQETGTFLESRIKYYMAEKGLGKLILAGTSAAATQAISLTAENAMQPTHLMAIDPVGLQQNKFVTGALKWARYNVFTDRGMQKLKRSDADNQNEQQKIRIAKQLRDIKTYSNVWMQPLAATGLVSIAYDKPEIGLRVDLPQYSFTSNLSFRRAFASRLTHLRRSTGSRDSINASVQNGALHSSGSNFGYFLDRLRETPTSKEV